MAIMSVAILGIGLLGITSVSFNDVSQASSLSQSNTGAILGHVTAIHSDADGNILKYSQGDNIVVDEGIKQMGYLTFGSLKGGHWLLFGQSSWGTWLPCSRIALDPE